MSNLNVAKSSLDSIVCNKMLKHCAAVLSAPVCALINNSLLQCRVPLQWKHSRISPIPKCSPVVNIETDLRPIAITCPVSKIAEFFVSKLFDEFYDDECNQFGSVKGRSTTLALIKLTHLLFESSDVENNIIRILFIDFARAFEVIDHNVICRKLDENNCPRFLRNWLLSFLTDRSQFVKVNDCVSTNYSINAGAPQGTRAGPNCFKVLIKDLTFDKPFIKYVDDVTVVSTSVDPLDCGMQCAFDYLLKWCDMNSMRLNVKKTKEMVLVFGSKCKLVSCPPLQSSSGLIEQVSEFKILGVVLSADLSWSRHVNFIVSKASKRLFAICQLARCGFAHCDIVSVYCSLIRPILEYACQVWHCGLSKALSDEVETVQKRCLRIIFPLLSYADALFVAGIQRLDVRRELAVRKTFEEMKNPGHVLNYLLPRKADRPGSITRDTYPFDIKKTRTLRASRSMISYCIRRRF